MAGTGDREAVQGSRLWGEPAVEAEKFPALARGSHIAEILYQIRPFPLFQHMTELRIDGELTGYTRRGASKSDYLRLARTFLMAVLIGIIVAGVYFAISPI